MNYILVKCLRQGAENNLCGYYVCEFIRESTHELGEAYLEQLRVCQQYSQFYFIAIISVLIYIDPFFKLDRTDAGPSSTKGAGTSNKEEICRFLDEEVLKPKGEYYCALDFRV